ncbi:MAG: DUF3817 domain-containing protein [Planctomycetota bacterium]
MTRLQTRRLLIVLRWTGLIEGTSTILLFFVAMPLKYGLGVPEPVTVVGAIHGGLFLAYVGLAAVAWLVGGVPLGLALLCGVASIFPGGPFFVDHRIKRHEPPIDPEPAPVA